jgi:hypothetical protein
MSLKNVLSIWHQFHSLVDVLILWSKRTSLNVLTESWFSFLHHTFLNSLHFSLLILLQNLWSISMRERWFHSEMSKKHRYTMFWVKRWLNFESDCYAVRKMITFRYFDDEIILREAWWESVKSRFALKLVFQSESTIFLLLIQNHTSLF